MVVADFSRGERGTFPEGWEAVSARDSEGAHVYTLAGKETKPYLRAEAVNSDILIAKEFEYHLREYPLLRWTWRALVLPHGADERNKETGDSGAAVYVVFPGRFRPANIKYVWSTSLYKGTTTESPYTSRTKIVVMRDVSTPLGKWVAEEVNVYEDYKRFFGNEPEKVQAIAIMSDSNNTGSRAEAHYGEIRIAAEGQSAEIKTEIANKACGERAAATEEKPGKE
jgi:hypothetical protein